MNAPLRRLSLELGLPRVGTVPEQLLAIAPRIADQERYKRRMLELAQSARREHERRVRGRGHGPRLPRLHGARLRCERGLRRADLDAARGDRGPRARPHARRVRGHRLARAAHAADLDLGLPRDDGGRGGGPRRDRPQLPGGDPAQHRPAASPRRGPAADRADRGPPGRARATPRSTSPSWRRSASTRSGRRPTRKESRSSSSAIVRRRSMPTAAGSPRCSTTSSRMP